MWKKKIREFRRKSKIQASGRRRMQRWQRVEERKEKKQKGPDEVPSGRMVGQEKCVCVCVRSHGSGKQHYKEAAVPLATAIVSNYILVSLDTRTYTAYVHTNTQTLPLQPTKKSLPCRLTRGGTWSDANTVSVCMCVLITVS